jgi:hypothetical protein
MLSSQVGATIQNDSASPDLGKPLPVINSAAGRPRCTRPGNGSNTGVICTGVI